jgi:hypothetical protein
LQQIQKEYEGLDYNEQTEKEELKQKMINLSKASNVLCPRTAFVGVMVDKDGVEKNSSNLAVDINISAENTEDMGRYAYGPQSKSLSMPMSRGGYVNANMHAQNRIMSGSAMRGPSYSMRSRGPLPQASARGPPPPPQVAPNRIMYMNSLSASNTPTPTNPAMLATSAAADMAATEIVMEDMMMVEMDSMGSATSQPHTTTTARPTTTTIAAGLDQLNSYLDLTNSQSVSGSWTFDDIEDYIQSDKLDQLKNLSSFNQNDISTVSGIILLQEKFSGEKQDWSASADKAWDSMTFTSRMTARSLIQEVISILEFNLSVFDVVM